MEKLIDFENEYTGYKRFHVNRENIKANLGKRIVYVDRIDNRGQYFIRGGTIHSIRYSCLYLDDMNREVDIRSIREAGIELTEDEKQAIIK